MKTTRTPKTDRTWLLLLACLLGGCTAACGAAVDVTPLAEGDPADVVTVDAGPDAPAPDAGDLVPNATCVAELGPTQTHGANIYCGGNRVTWTGTFNGEPCDDMHQPHACPSGAPCAIVQTDGGSWSGTCP